MRDRPGIDLLLARTDGAPMLSAVDRAAANAGPAPEPRPKPEELWGDEDAPDDLARQRWGIIAPAGELGDQLIDAIAPLVAHRRRQQGPVREYRVPERMTMEEASRWKKRVFRTGADLDDDLPRYQLILGDLDQVPLALQQVQASDGFVGRIAFDDLDGYRAYAAKIVRGEDRPRAATPADAILHAVRDGTAATRRGHEALIAPGADILRRRRTLDDVRYGELRVTGSERPSPAELWAAAAVDRPSVLLSLGHGVGVPRGEAATRDAARQRREQGALSFGSGGVVTGADIADRGFLPGGVWLAVACFAAGTAETSDYRHWLDTLRRTGHAGSDIEHVLDTLAHDRPFVAALPKAALADPSGPVAFVGHVDLAWVYSFFDLDDRPRRRPDRLIGVMQALLNGHRAGVAMRKLTRFFAEVNTELTALENAHAAGRSAIDDRAAARRGHLWMLRQDLAGYVLLGDPAVRLPIRDGRRSADDVGARLGSPGADAIDARLGSPGADDIDARLGIPGADLADTRAIAATTARAGGAEALIDKHAAVTRVEAAVIAVLRGGSLASVARQHGFDRGELERLVASYRAAGRAALGAALSTRR